MRRTLFLVLLLWCGAAVAGPYKSETVLRAVLEAMPTGTPSTLMTPTAAKQLRRELDLYLGDALVKLGPLKSLYGMGRVKTLEQFQATYEHGWIQWRVLVRPDGKIGKLVPFSINAPGTD